MASTTDMSIETVYQENRALESEAERLKEQLLGVRLIAMELSDEVEILRGLFQQGCAYIESAPHLKRIDELIEPLLKGVLHDCR